MKFSPHTRWTKTEKWLLLTPALVGVFALAMSWAPYFVRKKRGLPRELPISSNGSAMSLALSGDGNLLAVGEQPVSLSRGAANSIYLWQGAALKPLLPFTRSVRWATRLPDDHTRCISLSSNGRLIGYSRGLNGVGVFDRHTQKNLWQKTVTTYCLQFSPDGKWITVANNESYSVFETNNGNLLEHWQPQTQGDGPALAISPDAKLLATAGGPPKKFPSPHPYHDMAGGIELRSTADWKIKHILPLVNTRRLAFSPDGRFLVAVGYLSTIPGGYDGSLLRCFDVTSRRVIWEISSRDKNAPESLRFIRSISFSKHGTLAVSGSGEVLLLDGATGHTQGRLIVPKTAGPIVEYFTPTLAFSPNGQRLFGLGARAVFVWDLK